MNIKKMIEVMQAYLDGKKIEYSPVSQDDWKPVGIPSWSWDKCDYRIVPEPKKVEGRWERVEIEIKDAWYRLRQDIEGVNVVDALHRIPRFGGIDYQSPFDEKVTVRSMVPVMFSSDSVCHWIHNIRSSFRPGIPVAAWFWREGEEK